MEKAVPLKVVAPGPDDDGDWDWAGSLAENERLLLAELGQMPPADVQAGLAAAHHLDLAATRHAANRMAEFERRVEQLRAEAAKQVAEELDSLWPGNLVSESLAENDPAGLVRW